MATQGTRERSNDGALMGAPILLMLYTWLILGTSVFGREPIPQRMAVVGLLILGLCVVGAILGAAFDRIRR